MLTSKEILAKTGISRATLNNYIARGLLPKPLVQRPSDGQSSGPRQLGYFPLDVLARIEAIQRFKREGLSMEEIEQRLGVVPSAQAGSAALNQDGEVKGAGEPLTLTIEQMPHAAYMVNYKFEVTWFNERATKEFTGLFDELAPHIEDRSIFKLLLERGGSNPDPDTLALLRFNLALAKERMNTGAITQVLRDTSKMRLLEKMYQEAEPARSDMMCELTLRLGSNGNERDFLVYATYFREGILLVIVPMERDDYELKRLLSRRDVVIRTLLSKRLPVLTELAVLVADLQDSVKICSELPPDEYFELVNQIWAAAGDVFRRYFGTYGKHVGDGMVYYFFPQPDSSYIMNAVICAQELKLAMGRLSKDWQLRKNWTNELYLNTGLNEGQEWLGTFQTATSVEFVVLGETINHTARLSDLARFGQVWATKNFMSKIPTEHRTDVRFGIERVGPDGKRVLVRSSYSRVCNLVDIESGRNVKLKDIASTPVTEILDVNI